MTFRKKSKINLNLLLEVLNVQSKSNEDERMQKYLERYFLTNNITYEKDTYGNYYVTKGNKETYPCIVAHIDTVHSLIDEKDFKIINLQNNILCAINTKTGRQTGIGGDDKVGVYIALQALSELKHVKIVLYRNEEIGHLGSKHSIDNNKKFYENCNFVLQADRRDDKDFITTSGGIKMSSEEFEKAVNPYLTKYSFKIVTGVSTDVDTLVRQGIGVSCANISSGYYRPHTDSEVVKIKDVHTTYNLMIDICRDLGQTKFTYVYKPFVFTTTSYHSTASYAVPEHSSLYRPNVVQKIPKEYLMSVSKYSDIFDRVAPNKAKAVFYENILESQLKCMFVLKDTTSLIKLKTQCKKCKDSNIYFIPAEEKFYCIECNKYMPSSEEESLFEQLYLPYKTEKFVYDPFYKVWYNKKAAVWDNEARQYSLK